MRRRPMSTCTRPAMSPATTSRHTHLVHECHARDQCRRAGHETDHKADEAPLAKGEQGPSPGGVVPVADTKKEDAPVLPVPTQRRRMPQKAITRTCTEHCTEGGHAASDRAGEGSAAHDTARSTCTRGGQVDREKRQQKPRGRLPKPLLPDQAKARQGGEVPAVAQKARARERRRNGPAQSTQTERGTRR